MRQSFPYAGRHVAPANEEPVVIQPDPGKVLALVVTVGEFELLNIYAQQAIINPWGIHLMQPFRRMSESGVDEDFAEYLGKEIHVLCPARLEVVPEKGWMHRAR